MPIKVLYENKVMTMHEIKDLAIRILADRLGDNYKLVNGERIERKNSTMSFTIEFCYYDRSYDINPVKLKVKCHSGFRDKIRNIMLTWNICGEMKSNYLMIAKLDPKEVVPKILKKVIEWHEIIKALDEEKAVKDSFEQEIRTKILNTMDLSPSVYMKENLEILHSNNGIIKVFIKPNPKILKKATIVGSTNLDFKLTLPDGSLSDTYKLSMISDRVSLIFNDKPIETEEIEAFKKEMDFVWFHVWKMLENPLYR